MTDAPRDDGVAALIEKTRSVADTHFYKEQWEHETITAIADRLEALTRPTTPSEDPNDAQLRMAREGTDSERAGGLGMASGAVPRSTDVRSPEVSSKRCLTYCGDDRCTCDAHPDNGPLFNRSILGAQIVEAEVSRASTTAGGAMPNPIRDKNGAALSIADRVRVHTGEEGVVHAFFRGSTKSVNVLTAPGVGGLYFPFGCEKVDSPAAPTSPARNDGAGLAELVARNSRRPVPDDTLISVSPPDELREASGALSAMVAAFGNWKAQTVKQEEALAFARRAMAGKEG